MTREEEIRQASNELSKFHPGIKAWMDMAYEQGAHWADAHPKSPWTSVNDKLPPYGVLVYVYSTVYSRFGEWRTKRYEGDKDEHGFTMTKDEHGFKTDQAPYYAPNMQITHWMVVPELPTDN